MADILVLAAHPSLEHSNVNRAMMQAARSLGAGTVGVRDLYALYPDYLIDVEAEQAQLERARLVVWQHPVHWYGMPPLMKLWLDDVLSFGWAYGPGGRALAGKDLWLVVTTGGPEDSYRPDRYNRYFFDAFLPPYEQTAVLCGLRFLPPLVLHGAHRASPAAVAAHAQLYASRLLDYPDWPELADLEPAPRCDVPREARPAENFDDGGDGDGDGNDHGSAPAEGRNGKRRNGGVGGISSIGGTADDGAAASRPLAPRAGGQVKK